MLFAKSKQTTPTQFIFLQQFAAQQAESVIKQTRLSVLGFM
jgi:hypothetical protein